MGEIIHHYDSNEHFYSTLSQTMARPRQTRGQICTTWAPKMSNKNI